MKRPLELVEPLPSKIEDCFTHFDKVFDSLASQLDWEEGERVRAETEKAPAQPAAPPDASTTQIALVPAKPLPMPLPQAAPAPEPAVDVLQQFERAFNALDDRLAESDGGEASTRLATRPKRQLPSDRRAALKPVDLGKARRQKRANRSFDDVFGVLDNLATVRRREQFDEERQLVARLLDDTRQLCADLELASARVRVEFAVLTLENGHFDKLATELDELARHIRHDLRFCAIAPGRKSR